jgi:hypothetical protein
VRLAEALGADLTEGTFIGIGGSRFELGDRPGPEVERGIPAYARAIGRRLDAAGGGV